MSPIDVQDILTRAKNSAQVGDHEEAERLLKSYIAKVPDSREARLLLGTTFAKEGKLPEAADEFVTLMVSNPQDLEALNNAAVICRRQGKLQEALDYLKDAIDIDPTKAEFHYNLGNIYKQLDNPKAASMAYARVIELDPGYVSVYNNLGTTYQQLGEYGKAFNVFRKGLALDQNNPILHFNYGVALEANGDLEDAADEYRSALRSRPGWIAPMNNLGIVLFKQGRHDKAIDTFNHVIKADPFNAEAHNNIGVVLTDQGKTKEAVKVFRQAIESDPKYVKAVVNLERALESSGDLSDALIELEKLVKLSPDSAEIRNRLAGLYLKMERYPEALEQAESALDWEPDDIQALRIKGTASRVMGDDGEAQACFEKILSLDPGNYGFLLDLADIHFKRKEYKDAEERLQAYLIRRPNDRVAKLLLGRLYAEMGNRAHAIQIFEELAKTDPNDTEALAAVAELHKEAGSLEKALRTADTLVNVQGKRATADDLSELNKSLEFYENAVNAYSNSVKEMWNRNMKLLSGEDENASAEEDALMMMGASVVSSDFDEDTETLFTEGPDTFPDEEDDSEMLLGDDPFGEIPEEAEPQYKDPLDALAEDTPPSQQDAPGAGKTPDSGISPSPPQGSSPETSGGHQPIEDGEPDNSFPPPSDYSQPPGYPQFPEALPQAGPISSPSGSAPDEEEPSPGDFAEEGDTDLLLDDSLMEDDEPVFEEEIPEDIEEAPDFADETEELPLNEEPLAEEPLAEEPLTEESLTEEPLAEEPAASEPSPEPVSGVPFDVPQNASPPMDQTEKKPREGVQLDSVIGLLNCLKGLADDLPNQQKDTYMHGKFPAALDSVIDSLKKLTIIKEAAKHSGNKN